MTDVYPTKEGILQKLSQSFLVYPQCARFLIDEVSANTSHPMLKVYSNDADKLIIIDEYSNKILSNPIQHERYPELCEDIRALFPVFDMDVQQFKNLYIEYAILAATEEKFKLLQKATINNPYMNGEEFTNFKQRLNNISNDNMDLQLIDELLHMFGELMCKSIGV